MRVRFSGPLLLVAVIAAAAPKPSKLEIKRPSVQNPIWALVVDAQEGISGTMRINDIPAGTLDGSSTNGLIALQLRPGANQLELLIDDVKPGKSALALDLFLHAAEAGTFPEPANAVFALHLPWKEVKKGSRRWSFVLPADLAPAPRIWAEADVLKTLSADDQQAVRALVAARLKALQDGDEAALNALSEFMLSEVARLGHVDRQTLTPAKTPEQLARMKAMWSGVTVPQKLETALVGEGRVVIVTANGGQPPLTTRTPTGGKAAFPTRCVRLKGVWTLLE